MALLEVIFCKSTASSARRLLPNSVAAMMEMAFASPIPLKSVSCLSDKLPTYYDPPFPGPSEFISKFDNPAIISGITLPPFLNLWTNVTNVVIDIQATEAEDEAMIERWTKGSFTPSYIKSICNCYRKRYNAHLKLFNKVFTMANAEVKDKHFDKLDKFLTSI